MKHTWTHPISSTSHSRGRFDPNSEVGNAIEKTCRKPGAVGRVTPCAPRLQPAGANFPRRRLPDPLPIKTFLEFPRPNFGVRVRQGMMVNAFASVVGHLPKFFGACLVIKTLDEWIVARGSHRFGVFASVSQSP